MPLPFRRVLTSRDAEPSKRSKRVLLARRRRRRPSMPADLVTYGTGGLQPGVDLDDTSALLDLMEAPDDAHRR